MKEMKQLFNYKKNLMPMIGLTEKLSSILNLKTIELNNFNPLLKMSVIQMYHQVKSL